MSADTRGRPNMSCSRFGCASFRLDEIMALVIVAVDLGTFTSASTQCGSLTFADLATHSMNEYGPDSLSAGSGPPNCGSWTRKIMFHDFAPVESDAGTSTKVSDALRPAYDCPAPPWYVLGMSTPPGLTRT